MGTTTSISSPAPLPSGHFTVMLKPSHSDLNLSSHEMPSGMRTRVESVGHGAETPFANCRGARAT